MQPSFSTYRENGFTLRRFAQLRVVSWLGIAQFVLLPFIGMPAQAQPAAAPAVPNVIVPDGRTQTNVTTAGAVTSVTTATVSGANAFNSFSQFGVGQGNTVNLQLPTGTQNLINVVRDAPAYVNGTLNSYANGKIGGNVYFADPQGFVVGASGTVNVGSLNVSTPSREFTEQIIGAGGQVNASAVTGLMNGSFPISPDGNIRILGRVNAADGVRLTGQNVTIGGEGGRRAQLNEDHAAKFAATVNSTGLRSASGIVVKNGSIQIVAANDAKVSGRLTARSRTTTPSAISVVAGNNVTLTKSARISTASKTGDAGNVVLKAANDLTVATGASIDAGSKTGNAGIVELSANGTFDVGSGVTINLGAANGIAGTLLIDPNDVVVGDASQGDAGVTMSNTTVASMIAALSSGGTFLLTASDSVTLDAHAVIDTRRLSAGISTGNAYNVGIDAPVITVLQGAQILAQAINSGTTYTSGNVTLNATASQTLLSGQATASAIITVDGTITGANISIGATSTATSNFNNSSAIMALVGESLAPAFLGLNGGYVAANASAVVNINGHASMTASGNVSIAASATQDAEDPVLAGSLAGLPLAAAVVVGALSGTSTSNVASGATIIAGGDLSISAVDNATLKISAVSASSSAVVSATVAYSTISVTTTANVATGANLNVGTSSGTHVLSVTAINNNTFSTSASSIGLSTPTSSGGVGAAVAISTINTSATATLGASLGTSAAHSNASVQVAAISNGLLNSTTASTIVGTPALIAALQGAALSASAPDGLLQGVMGGLFSADLDFQAAAALSLVTSNQSATAAIAQNPAGGAPSIYANGNVAVFSDVIDGGVRSNATSSAIATDPSSGESVAVAAAVAWGTFTNNSNAYVGQGVAITAPNIAVVANTELPITNTWLVWDSLGAVLSHLNGTLGTTGNILTSYANATADAGDTLGVAGSLAHFVINNNTTAWVAGDARLTATCTSLTCSTDGTWTQAMVAGETLSLNGSIAISAATTTESIDAAGNIGTAGILAGDTSGGSSVGGSLNLVETNTNTIAGVGDGAALTAGSTITVDADTTDLFVGVAPTSGKAAGALALNGITSIALVTNITHASISNLAIVRASSVAISAQQDLSALSIAGAVVLGGGSGIGLAVAYLAVDTDTSAYIGNNASDIRGTAFNLDDATAGTSSGTGSITTDMLAISATTIGRLTVASVAAAVSAPSAASVASKAQMAGAVATGGTSGIGTAAAAITQASGESDSSFSIDVAGSSAVSDSSMATTAYIANVAVSPLTTTTVTSVTVQALNDTILDNGSGAAALNLAGGSDPAAAVSGAIALATSSNATLAYISNATLNNYRTVVVQALSGGSETAVALSLSGSTGDSGGAAAISASIGIITDSANAYIANSTLTGLSSTSNQRSLSVAAYQTSDIAIGGGSFYVSGGTAGLGIAMTYASIGDPTGGSAVDAHISSTAISQYDVLSVLADDASVIVAGAASGGLGANGLAGAIIVAEISPTTTAYISGSGAFTISVTGNVSVVADSVDVAALDSGLNAAVQQTNDHLLATDSCMYGSAVVKCVDFTAAALDGVGASPGASIYTVAGFVQAGKNNFGASLVYDSIATTHSATIAGVLLASSSGDVTVRASDSSNIKAVAFGFGLATGQFAGTAGITVSTVANTVTASIGNSGSTTGNSTVSATDVSVSAADTAAIVSSAIVGGASSQGSAAGLAIVYSDIENDVGAAVTGSQVRASGDLLVSASSVASIATTAVGIAISARVSLAGSIATNVLGSNVSASIGGGADVIANNNIGVVAGNSDSASIIAGALSVSSGAAGGAGSVVTSKITGTTSASISGATTTVDAKGTSSSDTLDVNSGTLANAIDIGGFSAPSDSTPSLTETQDGIRGLAVVASSHQAVVTNVASLAASSGVAIMANLITNVMGGSTTAGIDSASIDTRLTSSTLMPQIDVAASSFSYSGAFGLGIVAPTGTGGGGATILATTMDRTTLATVINATLGNTASIASPGAVTVKANAEQDASSVAVGFNSGSVGLNVFSATTEAYLDGGSLTAGSLAVTAKDTTGIASANGSGAYGSQAAIGAAFLVQVSQNTTEAYVGDEYHYEGSGAANTTMVYLTGALDIEAATTNNFQAYSVGGAASGGGLAVAGMANIEIATNTTIAGLYDTTVQSPSGTAAGAVTIEATENVAIDEIAGALALSTGGVGVGAAANVISFKSTTIAESRNSDVNSSGIVAVDANSTKEVQSYAVTAGAGASVGIGATIGVILIGNNGGDSDTLGQENGEFGSTIATVNATTNANQGAVVASGTSGNPSAAGASSTYDISGVLGGGSDGVTAQIAGGHVTAAEVDVTATSATATKMVLYGAGFSETAGVGAAIGYTSVGSRVLANLNAIVVAPNVDVSASVLDPSTGLYAGHTIDMQAIAGGAALYFGADAAVAVGNVSNDVVAELGGQVTPGTTVGAGVLVSATDTSTQTVTTGGGSGGIAAIGASVATTAKSSTVVAEILSNTDVTASMVAVIAANAGSLAASATAVGGGVIVGQGAAATASENSSVLAEIGSSSVISTSLLGAGVVVEATATPNLSTNALGVVAGAAAIGVAVAKSDVGLNVQADIGDSTIFMGSLLWITAMSLVPENGNSAYAYAVTGSGGGLIGIQGSVAEASNSSTVLAFGGKNLTLPAADILISAQNDSSQSATATGIAVGYMGLGATVAQASSDATTSAYLDTGAVTVATNLGALQILASGTDSNVAHALAGSGGIIAGAAAEATTTTNATTTATLMGNSSTDTLYFGGLNVQAVHASDFAANADGYQASAIGASGAGAQNDITSTVVAEIGTNLIVNSAGGDMVVVANDMVTQTGGGARAGSGGVVAGSATLSTSSVNQYVTTNIDAGTILSLNDDPSSSLAKINIEAYNSVLTVDTASMSAGGVFAGGDAESNMTAYATLTVNINATELFSAGSLYVGSASTMQVSNNADANLYGVITGAGASTNSLASATQNVTVSAASLIEAWGVINIYAGQAGDGSAYSTVNANATTVVYNYALIPATGLYRGTATAQDYSTLTLAGGSQVLGANNVFLGSTQGSVNADGSGTAYNPYLSIFSTANYDNHSHPDGSGNLVLNGTVVAGIHNQELITIALGATAPTLAASTYGLTLQLVSDPSLVSPIMSYNHQAIEYAVVGSFNPYQTIVDQLVQLSGLTSAQVQTALAATQPTITVSTVADPTGDIQRQINTLIQQAPYATNVSGTAFAFGNILASGGNVSILAQILTGTTASGHAAPSVTANASVTIDIENRGLNYINLSELAITGVTGGHVNFTGNATNTTSQGITFNSDASVASPLIQVAATYNATNSSGVGVDPNGHLLVATPDIYFDGTVTNLNGLLNVTAALGNVVASQTFSAATIQVIVPNGSLTSNGGAGSIFNSNNDVAAQWSNTEFMPTDTLSAVEAAATYLGSYANGAAGAAYMAGNGSLYPYYYYYNSSTGQVVASAVTGLSNASTVFTARLLDLAFTGSTLYSAIFLPVGYVNNVTSNQPAASNASALAQAEGTTTSNSNFAVATWQRADYSGSVYGGNNPINCSGCTAFFQTVVLQSAVLTPTAQNAANPVPTLPTNAVFAVGKAIILSASIININGTIQSGQSSNYSVNIGTNAQNAINSLLNGTLAGETLAQAQAAARNGVYFDLTSYLTASNSTDVKIGATYDVLTNQILLNNVVQGSGGYVYLNGRIISTSTTGSAQGNIVVNGGAGTVTVNNTTGYELVTNTINTGVTASSVIEIVDQLQQQTTWYVYNPAAAASQQVAKYVVSGVNASGYTSAMLTGTTATSGVNYSLEPNEFYQWVDTATLSRPVSNDPTAYGWTFNAVAAGTGLIDYTRTISLVSNVMNVVNGVTTSTPQSTNYQEVVTATGTSHVNNVSTGNSCCGTDFSGTWVQEIYDSVTLKLTNTVKASYDIGIQFNGGGTSTVSVTSNSSIVVDGSINNLQGTTTLTATGANSAIIVGAAANNPVVSGTSVTLTAPGGIGNIGAASNTPLQVQINGGTLTATTIDHDIAIAAIGSLTINQVKANPITGGTGISQGNIYLSASGDINSAHTYDISNPVIVGKSIEIDSSGGAIGATSGVSNGVTVLSNINPLVIQATGTTLLNGNIDGGLLNSTSSTGTYIVQSQGDLRLGAVTSFGPVFLEAAGTGNNPGSIINGISDGGLTAAQSSYLQQVWTNLNLVSGNSAAAVNSYQSMVDGAYNDYWQLRNLAFIDGQTYSLTATGLTVLVAQYAAEHGMTVAAASAHVTDIETEVVARFEKDEFLLGLKTVAQLGVTLDSLFGTTLASNPYFQAAPTTAALTAALTTYSSAFSYTLPTTSAVYAAITSGSQWTQDQLSYTVSADANPANGVAPPSISSLPLNVSGRQVMLYAPNGSIGSLAAAETFSFTSVSASSLTDVQKGLLASAGPGQLTVTSTTDPTTGVVTYQVSIAQQSMVIVNALGAISAKADSMVYLGSATDLLLGGIADAVFGPVIGAQSAGIQVIGGGEVRLDAVGSILEGVPGRTAISGNITSLTLIAETGSIGAAPVVGSDPAVNPNALQLALTGTTVGALDQVVSAQDIYINQTGGDLVLGNISASGAIQLAATGSIYAESQFTDRSFVHVAGASLDLRAGGAVSFNGTDFQPLQVQISGAITGTAVGAITIISPVDDITIGATGDYGTLSAGGALSLDAALGNLAITANVSSYGDMQLIANGTLMISAGTSMTPLVVSSSNGAVTLSAASLGMGDYSTISAAGVVTVATTGDAVLGQVVSAISYADAGNRPSIAISAGGVTAGAITANGDDRTTLVVTGAGAEVSLSASSIGTGADRISVDAPLLTATARDGGIYLQAVTDLEAVLLSAANGDVDMLGSHGLTLDSIVAGTATGATGAFTAIASAADASIVIGTATSGGSQTIQAGLDVTFNRLTTTGVTGDIGDISVTADRGFILAQSATANGVAAPGQVAANGGVTLAAATTITGDVLSAAHGAVSLSGAGLIDWTSLTSAGALGITSTGDSITLATAISGGSATLHASDNVTFNGLTTTGVTGDLGNVSVTADRGFILAQSATANGVTAPGQVAANGGATLAAATTITGDVLSAAHGAASLSGAGLIDWTSLTSAGAMVITSTGDSITLATATSGGSQTLHAGDNVTFSQLTTAGNSNDTGNLDVVAGRGVIAGGSIDANGGVTLKAATTNTGNTLTARTGSTTLLAGGQIDWQSLNVYGTLGVTSTTGTITLGAAISDGSQTIHAAQDISFQQLTSNGLADDEGTISLTSDSGALHGGSISAHGDLRLASTGSIALDQLRGSTVALSTPGDVTVNDVEVVKELDLAANTIKVSGNQIASTPAIPLVMNVTGYNGGVAARADLTIDPDVIIVNQLSVADVDFTAIAPVVNILNGYVTGQMTLTTPTERILLNNQSPTPSNWATIQLYQPGGVFTLSQSLNVNFTDSYVVQYSGDIVSLVSTYSASHTCCAEYNGSSMVKNIQSDMQDGATFDDGQTIKSGAATFYQLGLSGAARFDAQQIGVPVQSIGPGPAVNIDGASDLQRLRKPGQNARKTSGSGWRSSAVTSHEAWRADQFADAR